MREDGCLVASRCLGGLVERCDDGRFGEPELCPLGATCRDGACRAPDDRVRRQLKSLETIRATWENRAGSPSFVHADAVAGSLLAGDGTDQAFFQAARDLALATRQGHQVIVLADHDACAPPHMPRQGWSRFAVCGRPLGDAVVVTYARSGNALGLVAGDRIVGLDGLRGPALLEAAARRPVCGGGAVSEAYRRETAAASFFGTVPPSSQLDVVSAQGDSRSVVVPAEAQPNEALLDCRDPFGRAGDADIASWTRDDGVGVIQIASFAPGAPREWSDIEEYEAYLAETTAEIVEAFEQVKDRPALIWDVRGNTGGYSSIALQIVAGMAGVTATSLFTCEYRHPDSWPPEYSPALSETFAITPGGPFVYGGNAAVLIDGLAYSATDHFAFAVARATTVPLVGSPSAGAFGRSGLIYEVDGPPALQFTVDPLYCTDASTGEPLEGRSVNPTVAVEYDPSDLAAGIDTVLETAVALLLGSGG